MSFHDSHLSQFNEIKLYFRNSRKFPTKIKKFPVALVENFRMEKVTNCSNFYSPLVTKAQLYWDQLCRNFVTEFTSHTLK